MNALLGRNWSESPIFPAPRAIFLKRPAINGLPVRLTDTAGLRKATESIEELGVERSRQTGWRDAIVLVLDGGALGEAGATGRVCPEPATREVLEMAGRAGRGRTMRLQPKNFPKLDQNQTCCATSAFSDTQVEDMVEHPCALLLAEEAAGEEGLAPNARQTLKLLRRLWPN